MTKRDPKMTSLRWFIVLLLFGAVVHKTNVLAQNLPRIKLSVDASEAPRRIFHARLVIPAIPGPLTLFYPKWIPGEHAPTGPITNLAGLKLSANGKPIAWQRDLADMFAIHCQVPQGADSVEVSLDFLSSVEMLGFSSGASATARLAVLNWNQVLLYPKGWPANQLTFEVDLHLPPSWQYGTALPVAKESKNTIQFAPVSLVTLIDSPLLAGAYFRVVKLAPGETPPHEIDMAGDSAAALEISPEFVGHYNRLVAETGALFSARHYRAYHFLLTLSDHVAQFGLEHHESSDDRTYERALLDDTLRKIFARLLPHEFVHSWNGKYRRPVGLATPDYQQPMKDDLLWVYEGLTQYLGNVLTARSGLWTVEEYREAMAAVAAALDHTPGRAWRPLVDTAVAAQLLYGAPPAWASWRRTTDFYDESLLIWLEADVIIRQQTEGRRSLDDFCRLFYGGQSGPPELTTYTYADVVAALNSIAPYDWRAFFTTRLNATAPHAPLGAIEGSGWRLVYTDMPNNYIRAKEEASKLIDMAYSIGLILNKDGSIRDVILGMAAAEAGIGPGMNLVAVNGRRFSPEVLCAAVHTTKESSEPLELLVENAEYFKTYRLSYHGGLRYPHLEREPGKADLLGKILAPRAPALFPAHRQ